jgi:hypothetical protein
MRLERSSVRAEGGATVAADVRLPGAAEHKVKIFCLPRFVEDRRQMCFSRGRSAAFLPSHAYANAYAKRGRQRRREEERERTTTKPKLMTSDKRSARMLMTMMMAMFV